jgi:hypothetical protein
MFRANHAATRASASGSSGNAARCLVPRFRDAVTMAEPIEAGCVFGRRGGFGQGAEVTTVILAM